MTVERKNDFKDRIVTKLKVEKSMTFSEICNYMSAFGFSEWDVATTLPALCKEGVLEKIARKSKKKIGLFKSEEVTEMRYYLR